MKEVNIDLVVRQNYQEIINKTYKWKDEEIIAIYKFITNFINKNEMFFTNKEDMIQDLIWVFF